MSNHTHADSQDYFRRKYFWDERERRVTALLARGKPLTVALEQSGQEYAAQVNRRRQ